MSNWIYQVNLNLIILTIQKDKQQRKYNETLSKYNKELEKYEGTDSDFDKAMNAFGKLVKVLPKDEADNWWIIEWLIV